MAATKSSGKSARRPSKTVELRESAVAVAGAVVAIAERRHRHSEAGGLTMARSLLCCVALFDQISRELSLSRVLGSVRDRVHQHSVDGADP